MQHEASRSGLLGRAFRSHRTVRRPRSRPVARGSVKLITHGGRFDRAAGVRLAGHLEQT